MFFKRAKKSEDGPAANVAEMVPAASADKLAVAADKSAVPAEMPVVVAEKAASTSTPLDAEKLRRVTAPAKLGFKTTADVAEAGAEPFEARRVWDALRATFMNPDPATRGHALITVPIGCNASRAVASNLGATANAVDAAAPDWVYLRSADDAGWTAIALPAGQGQRLIAGMAAVLAGLRNTLPYLLSSEDLKLRRLTIEAGFAAVRDDAFARLHASAHAQNVAVVTTPMGFAVAPMHEGKVVKPEVLARLPQAMRDDVRRKVENVEAELQTLLADVPIEAGSQIAEVNELIGDYVRPAVAAGFEGLNKEFSGEAPLMSALAAVQQDILVRACRDGSALTLPDYHGRLVEGAGKSLVSLVAPLTPDAVALAFMRAGKGAVLVDVTQADASSSALAALKSVLYTRSVTPPGTSDAVAVAASAVVIAAAGESDRLGNDEPAFAALLTTRAAFAADAARSEDSESALARMLAFAAARRGLLPIDASAVALLVAEAARATGRPDRLSGDLTLPLAIAAEASRIAALASRTTISDADIVSALAERRASAQVQPLFASHAASVPGRVLAIGLGPEPVEVWGTVRPGRGTAADIARGLPNADTVSPAAAMLWSYIAGRFVPSGSLSLAAAIVHEPPIASQAAVRASAAELFALLSALAEAPVPTSFAVAGWVSPPGALLPIQNINEAIESAFDHTGGRDAAQPLHVVIPRGNEAGLMLRADLVEAARKGKLQILTAADVDEGLSILTSITSGSRTDADGGTSLNKRIEDRLTAFARRHAAPDTSARNAGKATTA